MVNQRTATPVIIAGLAGLLFGTNACGPTPRFNAPAAASPRQLFYANNLYSGKYTSIAVAGDYITGTINSVGLEKISFKFKDADGKEMYSHLLNDTVPEELQPDLTNCRWVIPLQNFASHGNGPFFICEINGTYSSNSEGLPESVNIQIDVPSKMQGWEQVVPQRIAYLGLPQNSLNSGIQNNIRNLHGSSNLFVRHEGAAVDIIEYDNTVTFKPVFLSPIWSYDEGIERNNEVLKSLSYAYVAATVFENSPLNFANKIIIDEKDTGGKAWPDGLRLTTKIIDSRSVLHSYIHEYAHVIEINGLFPLKKEYDNISWNTITVLDKFTKLLERGQIRSDATADDFFSAAAMGDNLEDLADTTAFSVSRSDEVRAYALTREKFRQKCDYIKQGLLRNKDWTSSDLETLENLAGGY